MSGHLTRAVAPISAAAWAQIESEAIGRLQTLLAGRKLVEFRGPFGWQYSAVDLGRTSPAEFPATEVRARVRRVLPLIELRVPFSVSRAELDDASRGALDIDLDDLDRAVERLALAENAAIFDGYEAGGIVGLARASTQQAIELPESFEDYPAAVARAVNALRLSGIDGPYGMGISPEGYTGIVESTERGGQLVFEHLRQILDGPMVWAPGITGAVVLSLRGDDFVLDVGQDVSIGYLDHDADRVQLYLEESFAFRVLEPAAVVSLLPVGVSSIRSDRSDRGPAQLAQ